MSAEVNPFNLPSVETVRLWEVPSVLETLIAESERLSAELETLPPQNHSVPMDAFGYHGGFLPALDELPSAPRWTLEFEFPVKLKQLVMIPAVDSRFAEVGSYGFPRRFRVLGIRPNGKSMVLKEWMAKDCPDPGHTPFFIDVPAPAKIRIEVFRGACDGERELFALDELFGIGNSVVFECKSVTASSEYESLPYWSRQFLIDHRTSLGLPLGGAGDQEHTTKNRDFSVVFDETPAKGCMIELDLGARVPVHYVTLFPAQPPEGGMIPGYGFPKKIHVRMLKLKGAADGANLRRSYDLDRFLSPGNNIVSIALPKTSDESTSGRWARWIQIFIEDMAVHNGKQTFAMGEILVSQKGDVFPVKQVRLKGFPAEAQQEAGLMTDRYSGGYPVALLPQWLRQLARQGQLSRQLVAVKALRSGLERKWKMVWQRFTMSVLSVLLVGAGCVVLFFILQKRLYAHKLRSQISSDLHDDVGSILGSISMLAEELGDVAENTEVIEGLDDLSLMALEAGVSLREVVWLIDQKTILLPDLLNKLTERAARLMGDVALEIELPKDCPKKEVSLTVKRHLIMFFKEVVHNCAKYASASWLKIGVVVDAGMLHLSVKDNGCGFDVSAPARGWGVSNMKKRADELGGSVQLISQVGEGTLVTLSIPMDRLSKEPRRTYKTSN